MYNEMDIADEESRLIYYAMEMQKLHPNRPIIAVVEDAAELIERCKRKVQAWQKDRA